MPPQLTRAPEQLSWTKQSALTKHAKFLANSPFPLILLYWSEHVVLCCRMYQTGRTVNGTQAGIPILSPGAASSRHSFRFRACPPPPPNTHTRKETANTNTLGANRAVHWTVKNSSSGPHGCVQQTMGLGAFGKKDRQPEKYTHAKADKRCCFMQQCWPGLAAVADKAVLTLREWPIGNNTIYIRKPSYYPGIWRGDRSCWTPGSHA